MRKHQLTGIGLLLTLALSASLVAQTAVEEGKQYRVVRTDGKEFTGVLVERDDRYEIQQGSGITVFIAKNRVAKVTELEAPSPVALSPGGGTARRGISPEEIEAILGSEHLDIGTADRVETVDLRAPVETDMESVREMLRIAGPKAQYIDSFPHFVLVYTSSRQKAQELGARLEAVYEWHVRYMEMLDLPRVRAPEAKLEIYFFGTFEEYSAYQAVSGMGITPGAIGFYMRTINRSAFFDMMTYPPYVQRLEQANAEGTPPAERTRIRSEVQHEVAFENLEVVQHEAAHHIHFNIGIFPARGDVPRWMSEGLATMFEFPPREVGASLGATNHYRLFHFRNTFGEKGERLPDMRTFILNDGLFFQLGFHGYSIGWALNHYMFREHRDAYAKWMRLLGERDDDWNLRVETADKQEQFEEIFGEINDEWVERFNDYIASIPLKTTVLPPSVRNRP